LLSVSNAQVWFRVGPNVIWQNAAGSGAIFDPASGETFFLSELPAIVLLAIDRKPAPLPLLLERLGGPVELDGQTTAKILAALSSLESAELIESGFATAS
jgi:hypothetical protein